jgi:hypothetical protein
VDAWRTNKGYTTTGTGTCYCTIKGTKYSNSISASQSITHNSHTVLFRRNNVVIAHNADGSYKLGVSAYIKHSRFESKSQGFSVNLTKIPRQATITRADNFTDEGEPVLEVNNPAGDAVEALNASISLDGVNPLVAYRSITLAGGVIELTLTAQERTALIQASPNSNTLPVYYMVKTTIGGLDYTSIEPATMTIVNANPTITGASYEDNNPVTLAITNDSAQIIQANSTVLFNFTTLTALKYATLASIAVTISGTTQTVSLSGASASNTQLAWGAINSANNLNAVIVLTDSRGNTTALSMPITMLAWALPTAIITCERKNNFYDETYLTVNGNISSLDNKNSMSLSFKYKEDGASSWSAEIPLTDEVTYTVNLDNSKRWLIQVKASDRIGQTLYNLTLDRGLPIAFFDRLKKAFAIEKLPTIDNGIDSAGDINSDLDVTAGQDLKATRDVTAGRNMSATGNITAGGDLSADDITASGAISGLSVHATNNVSSNSDVTAQGCSCACLFSQSARAVGKWIDGSTIYERVIVLPQAISFATNTWTGIIGWSDTSQIIDVFALNTVAGSGNCWKCFNAEISNGSIRVQNTRSVAVSADTFIIRYFDIT